MLLHLLVAAVVVALLATALLLLVRASEPVWATAPKHKADHPPEFGVDVEVDWSWPR